jgi:hypothetical protein
MALRRVLAALLTLAAASAPFEAQTARAAPPPRLRVLVPAYFYPFPGSPWDRLTLASERHPGLIWAIGNPASGPGASPDPTYVTTFQNFQSRHGRLLGYVTSSYGTKPLAALGPEIDLWFQWYGVDGVFVDEMDNTPGAHEAYYNALYDSVLAAHPGALVVSNPGTSTSLDYLDGAFGRCTDVVCVFENSTPFASWSADPWMLARPRREFYALPYATSAAEWTARVDHAFQQRIGWFYTTDDVLPNPWDTLPSYFEAMVAYIERRY